MSTLLLRLAAPLQSWGLTSKYESMRTTERIPTKSGVIGMIAAALGRRRDESMDDLARLRFGVRTDQEGKLLRDYHTVDAKSPYVTNRYYLSDAVFLVGLEGDETLLERIVDAIEHPAFPLFLGRRSCPPEGKISLGIRYGTALIDALANEPWLASSYQAKKLSTPETWRVIFDAGTEVGGKTYLRDIPLSFSQVHRQFGFRPVTWCTVPIPSRPERTEATTHDPMNELEEAR